MISGLQSHDHSWLQELAEAIDRDGFSITEKPIVDDAIIDELNLALEKAQDSVFARKRMGETYALRNILQAVPEVEAFACSEVLLPWVRLVLGAQTRPVKAILFDKNATANWNLGWHQDNVISVRERLEVPGFTAWSEKVGIPHVRPPVEILEQMLAARIHLDDCPEENGALVVIPRSHARGRLTNDEIQEWVRAAPQVVCSCVKGQVLFMRPLLLHSSGKAKNPASRRVLHIEYAARDLPNGLEWGV